MNWGTTVVLLLADSVVPLGMGETGMLLVTEEGAVDNAGNCSLIEVARVLWKKAGVWRAGMVDETGADWPVRCLGLDATNSACLFEGTGSFSALKGFSAGRVVRLCSFAEMLGGVDAARFLKHFNYLHKVINPCINYLIHALTKEHHRPCRLHEPLHDTNNPIIIIIIIIKDSIELYSPV